MTAATASSGLLARWMLLCCTLFGLAAMHTVGHTGPDAGLHAATAQPAGADAMVSVQPALMTAQVCPAGHCDDHGAAHVVSVCVAILQGLATAVLLVLLLLAGLHIGRGIRDGLDHDGRVPRGPPHRTTGLTIASATVLRI